MTALLALVLLLAPQNKKPPAGPPLSDLETAKLLESGQQKLQRGDFAPGMVDFNRVLQSDPRNAKAISNRGLCQSGLKQYDKAMLDFSKALEIDPRHTYAFVGQGDVHLARRQFEDAINCYTKAIEVNPLHPSAHALRGLAWIGKLDYAPARNDFDRAIKLLSSAKEPTDLFQRGASKHWAQDFEGAEADLTKAVDQAPRFQQALFYRGRNRVIAGKPRDAQQDLRRAVDVDPKDGQAGLLLGDAYYFDSQWGEAMAAWRKAIENDPSVEEEARLRIWRARARNNERDAAIKELQEWEKKLKKPLEDGDVKRTLELFVGALSADQFLIGVEGGDDRRLLERRCARLADLGLLRLLAGDASGAQAHFQKAVETKVKDQLPYAFSLSQLPKK